MYAKAGDLESAVGHARLAWTPNQTDADLTVLLGELHLAQGNRREARRIFRIGQGHHPDDPRMADGLSRANRYGR